MLIQFRSWLGFPHDLFESACVILWNETIFGKNDTIFGMDNGGHPGKSIAQHCSHSVMDDVSILLNIHIFTFYFMKYVS